MSTVATAKPSSMLLSENDLNCAFSDTLGRQRVSPFYMLAMMIVAGAMVLLPLLYAGLIGCVLYGMYYHATQDAYILTEMGAGRGATRARLFVYFVPLVIGAVLVLFMVKPIFARPGRRETRHRLLREKEPVLFAFVERLCEAVGAPRPREIMVDCQVNASASFRQGLLSFLGRDLVLTIGLPLVAGMTLRQLTGVLAHEFGHFRQGLGMRVTYVIRSVSAWFARVVYERDIWDERLKGVASAGGWLSIGAYLAMLFVWLTRKVLWLLMVAGHAISCLMMRQMEYDADACAVRVVGSEAFAGMSRQVRVLSVAADGANQDLFEQYRERMLADDLVALTVENIEEIPPEVFKAVDASLEDPATGFFDTHPSQANRIAAARAQDEEGVFAMDGPAASLFRGFEHLSRTATLLHYEALIGDDTHNVQLISSSRLSSRKGALREQYSGFNAFYAGTLTLEKPLFVPRERWNQAPDATDLAKDLHAARKQIESAVVRARELRVESSKAEEARVKARTAKLLMRAGVRFDPKEFGLTGPTKEHADEAAEKATAERDAAFAKLSRFYEALQRRLIAALKLARHPKVASRLKEAEDLPGRSDELVHALAAIGDVWDTVLQLGDTLTYLGGLFVYAKANSENAKLNEIVMGRFSELHQHLTAIREGLLHVDYPFEHAVSEISIGRFILEAVPSPNDPGDLHEASVAAMDKIAKLHFRIVGQLGVMALSVEKALGLPSLNLPPEPTEGT